MFEIKGKYTTAKVMIDIVEPECISQITNFLNHPAFVNPVAIMPDTHAGKGAVIGFTMPLTDKVIPNVIGVDIGCFTKDTKIPLLNGIQYEIGDLIGKEFYVYSMNENGHIVPGKAKALKTRTNTELVIVAISGGDIIKCTPDQKFMLINGDYKEAKDLNPKDSLMPLYRSYQTRDGYEVIRSIKQKARCTHDIVSEYFLGKRKENEYAHHIDQLWFNNDPSNLEYVNKNKHSSDHAKKRNYMATDEFKQKRIKKLKENGFYDPKFSEKKKLVATNNIKTYMQNNNKEWKEKIKDNGKRGAKYFVEFNKINNNTIFTCNNCGRQIKGKGGYTRHTKNCTNNHKVLFVTSIPQKEDVYCLQVEKYHNFAISAGVFVHNCGMLSAKFSNMKKEDLDLQKLDDFIREKIPFGFNIHDKPFNMKEFPWVLVTRSIAVFAKQWEKKYGKTIEFPDYNYDYFIQRCKSINIDPIYIARSLGTLGGGNHFIEMGTDEENNVWLTTHSGSRYLGKKVCEYWQKRAHGNILKKRYDDLKEGIAKIKGSEDKTQYQAKIDQLKKDLGLDNVKSNEMEYLEGEDIFGYLFDMIFCQIYAEENRFKMLDSIGHFFNKIEISSLIQTIHNYINPNDMIIRKGAISSYLRNNMIIPLNMRDGILICRGKSNPEWNFSAPHGAGRVLSRSMAKKTLDLEKFKETMSGIYSSSVLSSTLDEAPDAYKDSKLIEEAIAPTAEIINRVKPFLNMKDREGKED